MTNSHFGHDRDGDCINNLFDHLRIALMALSLDTKLGKKMNVHTIRATPPRLAIQSAYACTRDDDNQTFYSNVGWDPLEGHDGTSTSFLSNTSLIRINPNFKSVEKGQSTNLTCSGLVTSMMTPP